MDVLATQYRHPMAKCCHLVTPKDQMTHQSFIARSDLLSFRNLEIVNSISNQNFQKFAKFLKISIKKSLQVWSKCFPIPTQTGFLGEKIWSENYIDEVMIISKSIFDYFEICPEVEFEKVDTKQIEQLFDAFWNLNWDETYLGLFSSNQIRPLDWPMKTHKRHSLIYHIEATLEDFDWTRGFRIKNG